LTASLTAAGVVFFLSAVAISTSGWCRRCSKTDEPIAPRSLSRQAAFLTGRFAPHASEWQLKLWMRQCALFVVDLVSQLVVSTNAAYAFAATAATVILFTWRRHHCMQPYTYGYQNKLQELLDGAVIVFLVLACVNSEASESAALEVVMFVVVVGSFVGGAAFGIYGLRQVNQEGAARFSDVAKTFSTTILTETELLDQESKMASAPKPGQLSASPAPVNAITV
jgi:hypothetical protein